MTDQPRPRGGGDPEEPESFDPAELASRVPRDGSPASRRQPLEVLDSTDTYDFPDGDRVPFGTYTPREN